MITSDELKALNDQDLLSLVNAVNGEYNGRKRVQNAKKLAELTVGSRVTFLDKRKQRWYGKVQRILVKNVEVIADNGKKWRVHPSLLTKIKETTVYGGGTNEHETKKRPRDEESVNTVNSV
jgi:hypothetical protein